MTVTSHKAFDSILKESYQLFLLAKYVQYTRKFFCREKMNGAFSTNSDVLIPVSLQPNVIDLIDILNNKLW